VCKKAARGKENFAHRGVKNVRFSPLSPPIFNYTQGKPLLGRLNLGPKNLPFLKFLNFPAQRKGVSLKIPRDPNYVPTPNFGAF